jgi:[acyl-carrier-protein] S-malonyltransferase
MRVAFVFAGQGSQVVGMGKDMYAKYQVFRDVYSRTDDILGTSLSKVILDGPEDVLMRTENAQPAILAFSFGCIRLLGEHGVFPDVVAGHSLGEYSALVASGVLDFEDALRLVRIRGLVMERACPAGTGGMAAVIGLSSEEVLALCNEAPNPIWHHQLPS